MTCGDYSCKRCFQPEPSEDAINEAKEDKKRAEDWLLFVYVRLLQGEPVPLDEERSFDPYSEGLRGFCENVLKWRRVETENEAEHEQRKEREQVAILERRDAAERTQAAEDKTLADLKAALKPNEIALIKRRA